jgi:hypothetical protein
MMQLPMSPGCVNDGWTPDQVKHVIDLLSAITALSLATFLARTLGFIIFGRSSK